MMKLVKEVDVQRFTMVFELGLAKASDLSLKVEGMLTKNVGRVKFDGSSNKLIVTDTSAKIEEVRKVVNDIDQRGRQVLVEARIAQIALNDEHRMGVDWEAIVSDYHSLSLAGQSNPSDAKKRGTLSIGTIADEDYSILIEALDTVGSVDILSTPSVTAINNKEARILVGPTQPYVTTATAAPSAGPSTTAESVNFIDVGVKLFVTPTVHADGFITMKIRPEVSSMTGSVSPGASNAAPVVETSEAETTVHVKNGVTIVIGGLIKEEKTKMTKKVPILGDVPFLGMAFRSYSHDVKKTEIVIFLTPKVTTVDAGASTQINKEKPPSPPG
jgi:type II secretory pathway component GspD/PulD (secretin)